MGEDSNGGVEGNNKKIHPFFADPKSLSKPTGTDPVTPVTPDPSCSPKSDKATDDAGNNGDVAESGERKRKRRKTDPSTKTNSSTTRNSRPKRQARVSAGASIASHFTQQDTAGEADATRQLVQEQQQLNDNVSAGEDTISPLNPASNSAINHHDVAAEKQVEEKSKPTPKPQKLLKFNPKTGTIGPPPNPKPTNITPIEPSTTKTGSKRGRKRKTFVVRVRYGEDEESRKRIGQKVDNILSDTYHHPQNSSPNTPASSASSTHDPLPAAKQATPRKSVPPKRGRPKKPTHPFFQGKPKQGEPKQGAPDVEEKQNQVVKSPAKRQTIFTSTPCSPRHARPAPSKFNIPHIGMKAGGLKVPGAQHPAWPWRGVVHIRDDKSSSTSSGMSIPPTPVRIRKAKGQQVHIAEDESIMHQIISDLEIQQLVDELKALNTEDFRPLAPLIRIPSRHFESGRKLRARVSCELRTWKSANDGKVHPAIAHAYSSLCTSLSAFDRSTCEISTWAQKYAPCAADRVLQAGREAELLRDWLQTLKVQSVDTGLPDNGAKSKATGQAKRKRKRKKLDGFVISSDEEADELGEISEQEQNWPPAGSQGSTRKTVIRSGGATSRASKDTGRLTNAVVLSGPPGCGKTATVYAIAKELDFEVFEINPGARRHGKDILEKVGDMTRNHLVQHKQEEEYEADATEEDEVSRDLKSGKQGMMTSFFKAKPTNAQELPKRRPNPPSMESPNTKAAKKPSKNQKQSLILLEEVDILYEEDKQFWTTVISMITQSKRPFIMTCNDETLVPLQSLHLHGIFRFSSPPKDLAVDLLLLIAANEGHALRRHPVETLYDSRGQDLRASITELNYWCQIGVGDLQGGFNWFYPRWPKGRDIDEQGDKIRVVSEDTYHSGMGWLNRDSAVTESSSCSAEEELHRQTWDFWGLDTTDSSRSDDFAQWAMAATNGQPSKEDRLMLAGSVDDFTDAMSASDICATHLFASSNQISIDPTCPDMPAKMKDDFTVGRQLLEVSPLSTYGTTSMAISTTLKSCARARLLSNEPHYGSREHGPFEPLNESRVTAQIEQHLHDSLHAKPAIARADYSVAFDPIAVSEKSLAGGNLDPSVFDRTMQMITLDVAPYVRNIVASDQRYQKERLLRSNLLSEGGKPGKKRMRTTRSAYSALEGGPRARTRREKYFSADINPRLVMRTGGRGWDELTIPATEVQSSAGSAAQSPEGDMDSSSE